MAIILDKKTWGLNNISARTSVLDEKIWNVINIAGEGPPPGISGVIVDVRFWNGEVWSTAAPTVSAGSIIGIKATGKNTGDALASMTINAVINDPDGIHVATATNTVAWVATNGEMEIECKTTLPADTEKEGNYTAYIELIGHNTGVYVLDSWENKIAIVGAEKPFPWKYVGIGLGTLGAILLVPKKKK